MSPEFTTYVCRPFRAPPKALKVGSLRRNDGSHGPHMAWIVVAFGFDRGCLVQLLPGGHVLAHATPRALDYPPPQPMALLGVLAGARDSLGGGLFARRWLCRCRHDEILSQTAERASILDRFYASAASTHSMRASLFVGLHPLQHDVARSD